MLRRADCREVRKGEWYIGWMVCEEQSAKGADGQDDVEGKTDS